MKSKKVIATIIVTVIALAAVVCMLLFRDFDAQGYVNAVIKQNFYGSVDSMADFVDGKTKEDLMKEYEDSIQSFVESNITAGVEMDEELQMQYVELCKEIFAAMKIKTKEAEKISYKEYHVSVAYKSVDVFQRFSDALPNEKARIEEKVESGQYKGTEEEITKQMQQEYISNSYGLLKTAFQEMQYSETQTMEFVVKKNDEGLFVVDEGQIHEFVVKIMGLDTNQD